MVEAVTVTRAVQKEQADELEELLIAGKEIVKLLREGESPQFTHALLYTLRWQIGRMVLVYGRPVPTRIYSDRAKQVIYSHSRE